MVFSAAERGFFRAFALGVSVKDRLVLDEESYLVPLLEAMHRQRRYLVVLTDSHRGRLGAHAPDAGDRRGRSETAAERGRTLGQTAGDHRASSRRPSAARCTRCQSIFATLHGTCPFCQGTCDKVNLWQEILLFAARRNITAHTVENNAELSRHGGVAAVLSREEPWEPAAAEDK